MKTQRKLYSILCSGAIMVFSSCELNSTIKTPPLPETISNFKISEKLEQFKTAFPAYADELHYEAYWKENFDGEDVYAIPSMEENTIHGVLYLNSDLKAAFETRAFNGPTATIVIGDLVHDKSVAWQGRRIADHLYSFGLAQGDKIIPGSGSREDYVSCVSRVYYAAHKACFSDPNCTTLCDNLPTCKTSMLVAAAWTCI